MGHTQREHARARTRACSFLSEGLPSALDGVKIKPIPKYPWGTRARVCGQRMEGLLWRFGRY